MEEHKKAGFGRVHADVAAAEAAVGQRIHIAPLGNLTKERPHGGYKHRLIQDLKDNKVNSVVSLPERLVLPRGVDHARDLATLACSLDGGPRKLLSVLFDFRGAFKAVPLAPAERQATSMG